MKIDTQNRKPGEYLAGLMIDEIMECSMPPTYDFGFSEGLLRVKNNQNLRIRKNYSRILNERIRTIDEVMSSIPQNYVLRKTFRNIK